jgi:hypothetical protein
MLQILLHRFIKNEVEVLIDGGGAGDDAANICVVVAQPSQTYQ